MTTRRSATATAVFVAAGLAAATGFAGAKDKKNALPDFVLSAQTVFVMIDPDAAIPVNDPGGNKTAREDVEKTLMTWGRLKLAMAISTADLVIVVRKGDKQAMNPTVDGQPPNDRPVIVQGTDDAVRIGAQQGRSPDAAENGGPLSQTSGKGGEIGPTQDMFSVYQGQVEEPLIRAPAWRYVAKDGLKGPEVRAVAEFKKALDEAVKQQQQKQKGQGQGSQGKP